MVWKTKLWNLVLYNENLFVLDSLLEKREIFIRTFHFEHRLENFDLVMKELNSIYSLFTKGIILSISSSFK